jgi:hypothetical protein
VGGLRATEATGATATINVDIIARLIVVVGADAVVVGDETADVPAAVVDGKVPRLKHG